jgi:hypothetical protein
MGEKMNIIFHIFVFPDQGQRDGGPYSLSQQRPKHEDHLFHLYCQIWLLFLLCGGIIIMATNIQYLI